MRRWSLSLLVAALLLAGCAGRPQASPPAPSPAQQQQQPAPAPAPAQPASQSPSPPPQAAGPCRPADPAGQDLLSGMTRVLVYFTCDSAPRPVPRLVPRTQAVLRAALEELLKGPSKEEQALGFHSFFSPATAGLLQNVGIDEQGQVTIDFADLSQVIPSASSSTGSQELTGELNRTVFQFPTVKAAAYRISGSGDAFWNWLQLANHTVKAPPQAEQALQDAADQAVLALKQADWATVAGLVHPVQGVRFSPYANVHTGQGGHLVFRADQLKQAAASQTVYTWGVHDGSGQPIALTFADYYKQFVYDADFAQAPMVQWDKAIGQGTVPDNIAQVYPGARFVEYHFPGFDPKYQGMDWKSLRLVFVQDGSAWRLVGIVHAGWTT